VTTDTFPKGAARLVESAEGPIRIVGIAKGSGMIAPDMATMLAYVFTDAAVPRPLLQEMLDRAVATTFNAITVDGDSSTSDSLMLAATGRGPGRVENADHPFAAALEDLLRDLACQVVRDGEGATKFVEIRVTGAADVADARRVAMAIGNSPLVKTAIAGEDPNWGRVVMAVGKSGARADRDRLAIRFGDMLVAAEGQVAPDYKEEAAAAYMRRAELVLSVDLGLGAGAFTAWTCDLTHGYIDINADYRS
jgi:glutamate N-acetyltransferase/amino-acid N-acetyltransferase